ncbi:MAG TPA: DUF2182 domain-containing protein [Phycisphaerae bacterium]|nr:DUF2182 domain-containing protein [Phycisphaerae bacterium]
MRLTSTHAWAMPGIYISLLLVFIASVAATIYFCLSMSDGMHMSGGWTMSMIWMRMPGQTWLSSAIMFLAMWTAMMVAMMLPSAMPMILSYYRMRRSQCSCGCLRSTLTMAAAYFLIWIVMGAVVYLVGVPFAAAAMHSMKLSHAIPAIIAAAVLLAGCLQFMPWTMRSLCRCRESTFLGMSSPHHHWGLPLRTGISRGIACVVCCSGPMAVLLMLGMMNPFVIIITTVVIAMEKLMPRPEIVVRLMGAAALILGLMMFYKLIQSA